MSAQGAPAATNLFCITCGYNQRGITSDRCPECGQSYTDRPPSPVRLPWVHRRHLGRLKSYWRTANLVVFHNKEFCEQLDTPINLHDARLFWLFSVLQAWLPLLAAALTLYFWPPTFNSSELLNDIYDEDFVSLYIPVPVISFTLIGALVFFAAATGFPSYFCHPRALPVEKQNRAIALSYFASAPIALTPPIIILLLLARPLYAFHSLTFFLKFLAALIALGLLVTWMVCAIRIVLAVSQRRRRKRTAALIILFWLLLLPLCIFAVPVALWYVAVLVYTLF